MSKQATPRADVLRKQREDRYEAEQRRQAEEESKKAKPKKKRRAHKQME